MNWEVTVPAGPVELAGSLDVPPGARGLVVFAHGSGSSRHSVRNRYIAGALREAAMATLLFDLLTDAEGRDLANLFDIPLLARRLQAATAWARSDDRTRQLCIAYFGASTGAAGALLAAADDPAIAAVVSRGGRPDLADQALARVTAPTLLIVGGDDGPVVEMNRAAQQKFRCPNELVIVPGAGHLFEEAGRLEEVAKHARAWLLRYLVP